VNWTQRTVLVVDDDAATRELLDLELSASGYATIFARDASGALAIARAERPDLIVLDVMLPGQDGFAVLEQLQEAPEDDRMPVVVFTGGDADTSHDRATALGAAGFLAKPFGTDELLSAIENALGPPGDSL
jgi:DNA-binding response OmpR family regulator